MNRRMFLRRVAVISSVVAAGDLLSGCGGPVDAPLIKGVALWLVDLAKNVGSVIAADRVQDWLNGPDASDAVRDATQAMQQQGFINFADSSVYLTSNQYYLFGVGSRDGFNVCAPFTNNGQVFLLEGPGLIGLALQTNNEVARDPSIPRDMVADAYIPSGNIASNGWNFRFDQNGWAEYPTNSGSTQINYTNRGPGLGTIEVASSNFQGGIRSSGTYDIQYAT